MKTAVGDPGYKRGQNLEQYNRTNNSREPGQRRSRQGNCWGAVCLCSSGERTGETEREGDRE